jgi:hypothetical protein
MRLPRTVSRLRARRLGQGRAKSLDQLGVVGTYQADQGSEHPQPEEETHRTRRPSRRAYEDVRYKRLDNGVPIVMILQREHPRTLRETAELADLDVVRRLAATTVSHSFAGRPCQLTNTSRPPGASERRKFENAATGSSKNMSPNWLTTRSNTFTKEVTNIFNVRSGERDTLSVNQCPAPRPATRSLAMWKSPTR